MENKDLTFTAVVLLISFLRPAVSMAIESDTGGQNRPSGIIFKLEKMRDKEIADIRKYDAEIQKCNTTTESSGNIIRKAREQGNIKAEQIARKALNTAQEAKKKNEELRTLAELNKKRVESALEYVKSGGSDSEAKLEQVEYENMNDRWLQSQRHLIEQRLKDPNPYAGEIYRSLKTKAPPALPDRKYDTLKPGDVLLFHPDDAQSEVTKWGDRFSSLSKSPASHTLLYLKEVNGKKLFLDNTMGRGAHVISEDEFMRTYAKRDALVASLAQPITGDEADQIWISAKEAIKKEAATQQKKSANIIDQTGYGLFGDDNMVCSEASRWALIKADRDIPETVSPFKALMGIGYGPTNFYSDNQNFIITPLWAPDEK
jgi:hypothetical protein